MPQDRSDHDPARSARSRWWHVATWVGVGVLSFLWGSAVLGVSLTLARRGEATWWIALLVGILPVLTLLALTAWLLHRSGRHFETGPRSEATTPGAPPADPAPMASDGKFGGDITDREREVLTLLGTGRTQTEIARELVVAPGTVKAHVNNIYRKLGARNRTEALNRAREQGLLG